MKQEKVLLRHTAARAADDISVTECWRKWLWNNKRNSYSMDETVDGIQAADFNNLWRVHARSLQNPWF